MRGRAGRGRIADKGDGGASRVYESAWGAEGGDDAMSAKNDQIISKALSLAERRRACLATNDPVLRKALVRRAEAGKLLVPFRSLFVRENYWKGLSPHERALHILRGLQRLHPDWVFCRESAALAWGLPLTLEAMEHVHVTSAHHTRKSPDGDVVWHAMGEVDAERRSRVRVTGLARTVFDVLSQMSFSDGLAVADRALRICPDRAVFKRELRQLGEHRRGASRVLGIMAYANPKSESWAESVARSLMITQGFATPKLQVEFDDPVEPGDKMRVDMLVDRADGSQVIIEVDGMLKYEDKRILSGRSSVRALADEQHREARLTLYRMPILRLSYQDLIDPGRFNERLERYGIPRSREVAREIHRLGAAMPGVAVEYHVMPLASKLMLALADGGAAVDGGVPSDDGAASGDGALPAMAFSRP